MASVITEMAPWVDQVRASSGTEACMSALRVARGYTGRAIHQVLKLPRSR